MSDSGRYTVTNPYDQSVVAEFSYDSPTEIDRKLSAAEAAQAGWCQRPLDQRLLQVREAVERFAKRREAVAIDISCQMGKPIGQALGEFDTLLDRAEQILADAPLALAPDRLPAIERIRRSIEHAPLGVVLNIAAWNYPLLVPVNLLLPAILAGNVVLLKHSERTPITGNALAECFAELELPNVVTAINADYENTLKLVADPRVDHIAFTGSVEVGRRVKQAAASRFVEVGLELGGKDAAYVAADADLEFAAANIVDGACYNAGQSCCAIERVYVHQTRYEEFLQRVEPLLLAYEWGDPLAANTTIGPLARRQGLQELDQQVSNAKQQGARLIVPGGQVEETAGNFFMPALIADASQQSLVMQEESFGPLLPVCAVESDQQAVEQMNDSRFGLTASIWTTDTQRAEHMAHRINAGTVFQNRADFVDPTQPWSGWGDSGLGSTLSRYGFYGVTRRKSLHFRE